MSTSTAPRCLRKTFLQITKSDCKSPSRWDAFSELCVFFIHKLDCKNEYLRKPFWAYLQKYFKKIFPVSDFSESGRD